MATYERDPYVYPARRLSALPRGISIAVTNRKGGVGKSTICANLAAELALRGYRVGVIDIDSQGQMAVWYGMQKENGLFKAMVGVPKQGDDDSYQRVPLRNLVRVVPPESYLINGQPTDGALFLLPSSNNTYRIPYENDDPDLFGELVNEFIDLCQLDFLLIDTAPTVSMLDGAVYIAVDAFIHVTETETLSLDGLRDSLDQIARFSKRRAKRNLPPNKLLGILPNKLATNLNLHRRNFTNLVEAARAENEAFAQGQAPQAWTVWRPVTHRKAWKEAVEYGQTIRAFSPASEEAMQLITLVTSLEEAIGQWLQIPL